MSDPALLFMLLPAITFLFPREPLKSMHTRTVHETKDTDRENCVFVHRCFHFIWFCTELSRMMVKAVERVSDMEAGL